MKKTISFHEQIMKETCDMAFDHIDSGSGPFAAIVVDTSGNIVGRGVNMVTLNNDPTQHAEIVAIRDACSKLNTYSLNDFSIYSSCEPCSMCLSAIYWARIGKVYYGNDSKDAKEIGFDDSYIYDELGSDIDERNVYMKQICKNYANLAFQKWDQKSDKKKY